jgi:fused signal recognition particle receptor
MMIAPFFQKTSEWFKTAWVSMREATMDHDLSQGHGLSEYQWDAIEMSLLQSDMGLETTEALLTRLKKLSSAQLLTPEGLRQALITVTLAEAQEQGIAVPTSPSVSQEHAYPEIQQDSPLVLCILGVNGSGKTTSLAKIAHWYLQHFPDTLTPQTCLIGAGDTYRAAAVSQLATWGERIGITTIKPEKLQGGDPAAVAYQTLQYARTHGHRLVLLDTAGRLQSHQGLMAELKKTLHICKQQCPPQARLRFVLVLDAHTGQNAHSQMKAFQETTGETLHGLILTKTEGSAKGGMVLPLLCQYKVPIWFLGTGETLETLVPFDFTTWMTQLYQGVVS